MSSPENWTLIAGKDGWWIVDPDYDEEIGFASADYTHAKEIMLQRTHIPEAPWWVVQAVDKKRARLNCIHHLLGQFPYVERPKPPIKLPERERHEHYSRQAVPPEMLVPEVY